jgi:hypothetical protein
MSPSKSTKQSDDAYVPVPGSANPHPEPPESSVDDGEDEELFAGDAVRL